MKKTLLWVFAAALCACTHPPRQVGVEPAILAEVDPGTRKPTAPPPAVSQALLPPLPGMALTLW